MNEKMEVLKAKLAKDSAEKLAAMQMLAQQENPEEAKTSEEERAKAAMAPVKGFIPAVSVSTGEKPALAPDMAGLRIFRSRIPGSSFVMREGYTIYFHNGWYETTDPSEISQLDAVANKVPTIHTEEHEKDIVEAIIQARREGFVGSVAEAMSQQITVEQRVKALRASGHQSGYQPAGGVLKLPTVLPAGGIPEGLAAQEVSDRDSALRQAIKNASAQSNS